MKDHPAALLLIDDGSAVIQRYEDILTLNGFAVKKTDSCAAYLAGEGKGEKLGVILLPGDRYPQIPLSIRSAYLLICILSSEDCSECSDEVYGCLDENSSVPVILSAVKKGLRDSARREGDDASSEEFTYRDIINGMNESVWVIDMDGPIINVNDKAVEQLGYSRKELIRRGLSCVDRNLTEEQVRNLRQMMEGDQIQVFETVHTTRDGRTIPVEVSSSLIRYHGKKSILSIARDIGDRKDTEKQLREQLEKDELVVKAMHHRIKNNLATLSNLLSLQSRMSTNREAKDVLQEALARLQSISLLYNKLLETGNFKGLSIIGYFRGIVDSLLEIYPEKGQIAVNWDVEDIVLEEKQLFPLGVIVDELITNIFKYGFPGNGSGHIGFSVIRRGSEIRIRIFNNGVPFPAEADQTTQKGFGLMIVRLLCKQIGGEYRMYREDGTVQEITFPLI